MGTSPKNGNQSSSSITLESVSNIKKLSLSVGLCLVTYLFTKPSTNISSSLIDTTSKKQLKSVIRNNNDRPNFWNMPNKNGEFSPGIAWLMSFPNSGTSFTMTCVEHTSNVSTATNYGDEVTAKGDYSLSIYPRREEGPFWEGLSGKLGTVRALPENYVLVKTHCGSRCLKCSPSEYVETYDSFVDACRFTTGRRAPDGKKKDYLYPVERVKKAIHLIRNPYHNFVARFHLDRKNAKYKGRDEWLQEHPSNATGFRRWCNGLDILHEKEEYEFFEQETMKRFQRSPCHGEVFKYVQWHNLAFEITERRAMDSLVVFYGDYETNFNETLDTILDFLELPKAETPLPFEPGHKYSEYYMPSDKQQIRQLVKEIADPITWRHLERYFDQNDPFFEDI